MSDPVTNAEVEDVLSSIRRLVSEDKRPLQAQKAAPANDRLVLTPALRVAEVHDDDVSSDVEEIVNESVATSCEQDEETLFDDPAHDYEADPYNFADEDGDDGEGLEALNLDGLEIERDDHDDPQDQVETAELKAGDAGSTKAATLNAKIEALETAIGNIADTWEPDEPGSDEYSGTKAPAMAWEDDVDHDAMGAPLEDDDEHEDEHNEDHGKDSASEAAAKHAAPPDVAPEPQPEIKPERPSQHDMADEDTFAFASDDQLIDEEALRDLVSDIVRAELQGALGERITRNVRKLVRREIHRALTAQELE
tara:strand:+ start:2073 stop:2999 length:927 start_codon:yes stop_codon:yes gene_type:complete